MLSVDRLGLTVLRAVKVMRASASVSVLIEAFWLLLALASASRTLRTEETCPVCPEGTIRINFALDLLEERLTRMQSFSRALKVADIPVMPVPDKKGEYYACLDRTKALQSTHIHAVSDTSRYEYPVGRYAAFRFYQGGPVEIPQKVLEKVYDPTLDRSLIF